MKIKILFSGGGSGGHIFPIIAIIRELRRIHPRLFEFYYLGPRDELFQILLSQEGVNIRTVVCGKIRRYVGPKSLMHNFIDIAFKIPFGIMQSFLYLFFMAPDLIFCKGGYASLPIALSGWFLQVPILLHESDVVPGLANKILSKLTLGIFTSFPDTEYFSIRKTVLVGNPIRREILDGSESQAKKLFQLSGQKPVILITGGSQGAQRINDVLLPILPEILQQFEVIHQMGIKNFEAAQQEARVVIPKELGRYYHPVPFLTEADLKHAYRVAQLIVSRAGSGSIFEIAALKKPSILIPLAEAAQGHQIKNAYAYAKDGASVVVEEINLTPHFLLEKIKHFFLHPEELKRMAQAAEEFSRPKAAGIIAHHIFEYFALSKKIQYVKSK